MAQASKAHSELCVRVFGKDLTQDGQGDMNALEFPNHSFDKVISLDTIYWVADIDDALAPMSREAPGSPNR